jgi:hypothetical protein
MAVITPSPRQLRNIYLGLGADQHQRAVSDCTMEPGENAPWIGGTPEAKYVDPDAAEWKVSLTFVQDWENEDSLARFLYEHEGEKVPLTFSPRAAGNAYFTTEVTLVAPKVGGAVNAWGESTVAMTADRKPTLTGAAPAAPAGQ